MPSETPFSWVCVHVWPRLCAFSLFRGCAKTATLLEGPCWSYSFHVRLASKVVAARSHKLTALRQHIPCEFAGRPRSVTDVLRWMATEFRQFLLYTGPVVLGNILPVTQCLTSDILSACYYVVLVIV